jgi:photosystem II stability/assembly factor-like uncharacterized protein
MAGGFVLFHPVQPHVAFAGRTNLYVSYNDGQDFDSITADVHPDFGAMVLDLSTKRMYVGTDGGVYVSENNGASWSWLPVGMRNGLTYSVDVDPYDMHILIATRQDYGAARTEDGGRSWDEVPVGTEWGTVRFDPASPGIVYLAAGGVWKSVDHGRSWKPAMNGLPNLFLSNLKLALDPLNSRTLWLGVAFSALNKYGLFRSDDGGASWRQVAYFSYIMGIEAWGSRVYAWGGVISRVTFHVGGPKLWRSLDGGATWQELSPPDGYVFDVKIDPRDGKTIYLSSSGGLYVSRDDGQTFSPVPPPPPRQGQSGPQVLLLQKKEAHLRIVAAYRWGTNRGVYLTEDEGATWTSITWNLNVTDVRDIRPSPRDPDKLYLATFGEGVVTARTTSSIIVEPLAKVGGRLVLRLSDGLGNGFSGNITLNLAGLALKGFANASGIASIPLDGIRAGVYEASAQFAGDLLFMPSSTVAQVRIEPVVLIIKSSFTGLALVRFDGLPLSFNSSGVAAIPIYDTAPHSLVAEALIDFGNGTRLQFRGFEGLGSSRELTIEANGSDISVAADYALQYLLQVSGSANYTYLGSPDGWYDRGSPAQVIVPYVQKLVQNETRENLWAWRLDEGAPTTVPRSGSGYYTTPQIPMMRPHRLTLSYIVQHKLTVIGGSNVKFLEPSPTSDGWYDEQQRISVATDHVAGLIPFKFRRILTSWQLDGGPRLEVARQEAGSFVTPPIAMNASHTLSFYYATQYYVRLITPLGKASGEGFYDANSTAHISITPTSIGFLVRQVFQGWTGDISASSPELELRVDGPKVLIAAWRADYSGAYILAAALAALFGLAVALRGRRRGGRATQGPQ